jgi:hypothetical protein
MTRSIESGFFDRAAVSASATSSSQLSALANRATTSSCSLKRSAIFGPEMRASFGIDELRVHTHAGAGVLHRPFEHVAHPKLFSDLLGVDRLALEGEGRVAGDHKGAAQAGEIRRQVLGDAVSEIMLFGIAAQARERKHHD